MNSGENNQRMEHLPKEDPLGQYYSNIDDQICHMPRKLIASKEHTQINQLTEKHISDQLNIEFLDARISQLISKLTKTEELALEEKIRYQKDLRRYKNNLIVEREAKRGKKIKHLKKNLKIAEQEIENQRIIQEEKEKEYIELFNKKQKLAKV